MIRPILTEVGLFLAPFAVYAAVLFFTRSGVMQTAAWSTPRLVALAAVSIVLMLVSFVLLARFSGAPPGSAYEPAHIENGVLVPGKTR